MYDSSLCPQYYPLSYPSVNFPYHHKVLYPLPPQGWGLYLNFTVPETYQLFYPSLKINCRLQKKYIPFPYMPPSSTIVDPSIINNLPTPFPPGGFKYCLVHFSELLSSQYQCEKKSTHIFDITI